MNETETPTFTQTVADMCGRVIAMISPAVATYTSTTSAIVGRFVESLPQILAMADQIAEHAQALESAIASFERSNAPVHVLAAEPVIWS